MPEIIPSQKLKIIPWPDKENLIVFQRAKGEFLFMGLKKYLKGRERKKGRPPVDNSKKRHKLPYIEVSK